MLARRFTGALFLATAMLAQARAETIGPWHTNGANPADLVVSANTPGGTITSLILHCTTASGFKGVLLANTPAFTRRVVGIEAKVPGGTAVGMWADQNGLMPGMISIRGMDAIEKQLLQAETLTVRVTYEGSDPDIVTFNFPGIAATKAEILKRCGPF